MARIVTWDFNGTLLADSQLCVNAGNHVIREYGGTPLPRRQYSQKFEFPALEFCYKQGADRERLTAELYRQGFYGYYTSRASRCRTRQGAREILAWLKRQGVTSVILSNHLMDDISAQLERLGLDEYVERILANESQQAAMAGNNKIARMRAYLDTVDVNTSDSWIIGDSPEDVGIGKSLGFRTVAVVDGYFSASRLRASNPDHMITNLRQLIRIVEGTV